MILLPAFIVLGAVVLVGAVFIAVASLAHWLNVRTSAHRSHRGLCPRCGTAIGEGKDHCSECGMIIPRKIAPPADADDQAADAAPAAGAAGHTADPAAPVDLPLIETVLPKEAIAFDPEVEETASVEKIIGHAQSAPAPDLPESTGSVAET